MKSLLVRASYRLFILIVFLVQASACAGWRSHVDPFARNYDESNLEGSISSGKSLLLTLSARHAGTDQESQEDVTESYRERGVEVLSASGFFTEVGTDLHEPDLELVLNINEREEFSRGLAYAAGATLLLIPAIDRVQIRGEGKLYSSDGEVLGELNVNERITVVMQLLMLPFFPTAVHATSAAKDDVFKSVLAQLAKNRAAWLEEATGKSTGPSAFAEDGNGAEERVE